MTKQEIELLLNMTGKINTIANWESWITPTLESLVTQAFIRREISQTGILYRVTDEGIRKADEIIKQHIELIISSDSPPSPPQPS